MSFRFISFYLLIYLVLIVIQLQLSAFSPHPSTPPQPVPPPSPTSTLPLGFLGEEPILPNLALDAVGGLVEIRPFLKFINILKIINKIANS